MVRDPWWKEIWLSSSNTYEHRGQRARSDGLRMVQKIRHDSLIMTDQIVAFLRGVGLTVLFEEIPTPTFLPGIGARCGALIIDREKLLYPGDLLHEAGHLALLAPEDRARFNGDAGDNGGFEMGAIAWSYAAARAASVPVEVLFHEAGYKGGAASLRESFEAGRGVGIPMLEWLGLAAKGWYPKLQLWLRQK